MDRSKVEDRLAATGYELLVWEDHSPLLKQLAAQLIWTYGSLDAFWSAVAGPAAEDALDNGRPGGGQRSTSHRATTSASGASRKDFKFV